MKKAPFRQCGVVPVYEDALAFQAHGVIDVLDPLDGREQSALVYARGEHAHGGTVNVERFNGFEKLRRVRPGHDFYLAAHTVGIYYLSGLNKFLFHSFTIPKTAGYPRR